MPNQHAIGSVSNNIASLTFNRSEKRNALTEEMVEESIILLTEDHGEGARAFLEMRSPEFHGK